MTLFDHTGIWVSQSFNTTDTINCPKASILRDSDRSHHIFAWSHCFGDQLGSAWACSHIEFNRHDVTEIMIQEALKKLCSTMKSRIPCWLLLCNIVLYHMSCLKEIINNTLYSLTILYLILSLFQHRASNGQLLTPYSIRPVLKGIWTSRKRS